MTVDGTHLTTFFTQDYRQGYARGPATACTTCWPC